MFPIVDFLSPRHSRRLVLSEVFIAGRHSSHSDQSLQLSQMGQFSETVSFAIFSHSLREIFLDADQMVCIV